MTQQDIILILTLAATQNITQAANRLYVTQPALSKRINTIEKELNIQLCLRNYQGVHFTPDGEIVLAHCKKLYQQFQAMHDELAAETADVTGTLRLGISLNFSLYRLPELLKNFKEAYPKVTPYIHTDHSRNLYNKLLAGNIDIAILRGHYNWSGPIQLLQEEPMYLIKPSADFEITTDTYISRRTDSNFEQQIAKWLYDNNIFTADNAMFVDNIGTCVEMVKRNLGWAIVPEICLDTFTGYKEKLKFRNNEPFTRPTYVLINPMMKDFKQVVAFLEVLNV